MTGLKNFFVNTLQQIKILFKDFLDETHICLSFSEFFRSEMEDFQTLISKGLTASKALLQLNELEFFLESFNVHGISFDHQFRQLYLKFEDEES